MPGIAMVTREPGCGKAPWRFSHRMAGSTLMVLFVGLISLTHRDPGAFREFDIKKSDSTLAPSA